MEQAVNLGKMSIVLSGGILGFLFGGFDSLIYALVAFAALDYITGVLLAVHERKVSSAVGFTGISKKAMIFVLVALGNIIDRYVIGKGSSLRTMLILFYLSNEGISILENAGKMGVPLPEKLKKALRELYTDDSSKNK